MHSKVFEENNVTLDLAKSPKENPRTSHIAMKYHLLRENFGEGKGIMIQTADSKDQKADVFTKGLPT